MISDWLHKADNQLLYFINQQLHWKPIDNILLIARQPFTWIPVYLFFFLFFFTNARKYILPIVSLTLLTFALTDFVSASLLKPFIGRLRPCHDTSVTFSIFNPAGCGGLFSMPSTHASNHFGLSTFWFLVIRLLFNQKWWWLWIWAILVGFAQIYVGVHFPGDIAVGALLGIITGTITFAYFKKWFTSINDSTIHE